jgi:hypothetical protein
MAAFITGSGKGETWLSCRNILSFIRSTHGYGWENSVTPTVGLSSLVGVPPKEWDAFADLGADVAWFTGVRERSPAGIRITMTNDVLPADFRQDLPDFTAENIVGSPYCVRHYIVDERLGRQE